MDHIATFQLHRTDVVVKDVLIVCIQDALLYNLPRVQCADPLHLSWGNLQPSLRRYECQDS